MTLKIPFAMDRNRGRTFVILLLALGLIGASFLLGLRSAIQKDKAYFWTKELKIIAYHEYNLMKDRFQSSRSSPKKGQTGEVKVFAANDFTLELIHLDEFGHTEKTAGFVENEAGVLTKYEQAKVSALWETLNLGAAIADAEPTRFRGGGLKQAFQYRGEMFGLVSLVTKKTCYFASLVNFTQRKEIFRAPCLPNVDELDFSSIGGAWVEDGDGIVMSLGTPSDDSRIANLAQDKTSPYGKMLKFNRERLVGEKNDLFAYTIHSKGHRNPQGMVRVGAVIYAVDHGPKGGDEINLLEEGKNYGWPLYSLGSTYQGVPHAAIGDPKEFTEPLFAFIPSIAPSDITNCPAALSQRYAPLSCVVITSLRGMSLSVGLIDANHRVVSLERVPVDMRLREFVHLPDNRLAVSTDDYGVYEIKLDELALPR